MFQLDYYNMLLTQKQIDVYNAIIGGKTDDEHDVKIKRYQRVYQSLQSEA